MSRWKRMRQKHFRIANLKGWQQLKVEVGSQNVKFKLIIHNTNTRTLFDT